MTRRENGDCYRAPGSGTKTTVFVVPLDGDRIAEVEPGPSSDSGVAYAPALDALDAWILRTHPGRAADVIGNGALVFDGRRAPRGTRTRVARISASRLSGVFSG